MGEEVQLTPPLPLKPLENVGRAPQGSLVMSVSWASSQVFELTLSKFAVGRVQKACSQASGGVKYLQEESVSNMANYRKSGLPSGGF